MLRKISDTRLKKISDTDEFAKHSKYELKECKREIERNLTRKMNGNMKAIFEEMFNDFRKKALIGSKTELQWAKNRILQEPGSYLGFYHGLKRRKILNKKNIQLLGQCNNIRVAGNCFKKLLPYRKDQKQKGSQSLQGWFNTLIAQQETKILKTLNSTLKEALSIFPPKQSGQQAIPYRIKKIIMKKDMDLDQIKAVLDFLKSSEFTKNLEGLKIPTEKIIRIIVHIFTIQQPMPVIRTLNQAAILLSKLKNTDDKTALKILQKIVSPKNWDKSSAYEEAIQTFEKTIENNQQDSAPGTEKKSYTAKELLGILKAVKYPQKPQTAVSDSTKMPVRTNSPGMEAEQEQKQKKLDKTTSTGRSSNDETEEHHKQALPKEAEERKPKQKNQVKKTVDNKERAIGLKHSEDYIQGDENGSRQSHFFKDISKKVEPDKTMTDQTLKLKTSLIHRPPKFSVPKHVSPPVENKAYQEWLRK